MHGPYFKIRSLCSFVPYHLCFLKLYFGYFLSISFSIIQSLLTFARIDAIEISLILSSHFITVCTSIPKSLSNQNLLFQSIISLITSQFSFCRLFISFFVIPFLFSEKNISDSHLLIAKFKAFVIPNLSISKLFTFHIAKFIFHFCFNFSILINKFSLCFLDNFLLSIKDVLSNFFSGVIIPICIGHANGHLPASSMYNFIVI